MSSSIVKLVETAWNLGAGLDLSSVNRGPKEASNVPPYYTFLAGLCAAIKPTSILEIGTNYGGSAAAMSIGTNADSSSSIVTVDIEDLAQKQIDRFPNVSQIIGDANSKKTVEEVYAAVSTPLDLLFIDTKHDFDTTMRSFGIYFSLSSPAVVVLDDVTLNGEMLAFWGLMKSRFGNDALNVVDIFPEIRKHPKNPGFGLIVCNQGIYSRFR